MYVYYSFYHSLNSYTCVIYIAPYSSWSASSSSHVDSGMNSAVRPAEMHTISYNRMAEDFVYKNIYRLTDTDRRSFGSTSHSSGSGRRPSYFCKLAGCPQPWIHHRKDIKEHLTNHRITFPKPWACSWYESASFMIRQP